MTLYITALTVKCLYTFLSCYSYWCTAWSPEFTIPVLELPNWSVNLHSASFVSDFLHVTNAHSAVVTCRVKKSSVPGVLSLWGVLPYLEKVSQDYSSTRAVPKAFWIIVHSPHFCRLHANLSYSHELKTSTSAIWPAQFFLLMPKPSSGLQAINSCTSRDHGTRDWVTRKGVC